MRGREKGTREREKERERKESERGTRQWEREIRRESEGVRDKKHKRVCVCVCVCLHASHFLQNIGQLAEDVHGLGLQRGNTGGGDVIGRHIQTHCVPQHVF